MVAFPSSTPPPPTVDPIGDGTISAVHHDILQNHILNRLDGPTLAAVACASSELHGLSTEDKLWQKICIDTWPSINDPLTSSIISTFPSGHRSFFSDSYPLLHHHRHSSHILERPSPETTELISAVDIFYQNFPIFSKVEETETESGWFMSSPFRVDLIEPNKDFVPSGIPQASENDSRLKQVEQNLTLSWILIDPKQKRAVNISSHRAVSVQRHWLTGEVQAKFATILAGDEEKGSEREYVQFEVVVTCGGKEGGEIHVRDVSMVMEDMEGKTLTGKESLVILQEAMERGERRKGKSGKEGKERFKEFLERRKERKERIQRREKILDWVCIASGISSFMAFWSYILFQ
ncbi:hypothetical protein JCGZ_24267 [Jatropha curcas]|uniref:F-box domain-containing protein n=1 Tax=Jatropha curcas TaxID=180498 RepID=A0A067JQ63_JATCU|nr:hypothetical protein JCGZ_24267 [Jatropha curcas]